MVALASGKNKISSSGSVGKVENIVTLVDNTVTNEEVIGALASYNYFAKREIYGDTKLNMGRKKDSEVGEFSGAIGKDCTASAMYSVAMGESSVASGKYTLAKGNNVEARGECSSAEGYRTISSGYYSHAEGANTESKGWYSHAEGNNTLSSGENAHAEGKETIASGESAHAQGISTQAIGENSHAQGKGSIANGNQSSASGENTIASGENQTVIGKYNIEDASSTYAFVIGGGVDSENRKDIHTIDWAGNCKYTGDVVATDGLGNEVSLLELANSTANGIYIETVNGNGTKEIIITHNIGNQHASARVYDVVTNEEVVFGTETVSSMALKLTSDIVLTEDMSFKVVISI